MSTAGELAPTSRTVLASRLVGRTRERELLEHAIGAARSGQGRSVVVLGEAGIGKSRLAREAEALAAQNGLRVLWGRAVEARTPVAYRPLAEALCAGVRSFGLPDTPELHPFRDALGQLIPEWQLGADAGASLVTLSEGILRFLRAIAGEQGCLLVLEDLHWSDPETLEVLQYLADNLRGERLMCVATARVEEGPAAVELARALEARRSADVVAPARLTERELAEMVAACLGTDDVTPDVVAFARRSDGVPFLVEELLAVAVASGALVHIGDAWVASLAVEPVVPFTFADGIRRRMLVLGEGPRAVVHAAAVLGRRFDWALLPAITRLDEQQVLAALRDAVDTQLISIDPDDGTFRFRHALSRDAVLSTLLPPERSTLSKRALAALEQRADTRSGDGCELAADLAQQAGDRAKAAELLIEVGRRALDRGALATAESTFDRARVLSPAGSSVLVDAERCLTEVLAVAGKVDRAAEVGGSLLDRLGDSPSSTAARVEIHLQLARAAVAAARFSEVLGHLDHARAAAGAAGYDGLLARIDVLAAQAAMGLDRTEEAAALARQALDRSEALDQHAVTCEALELEGRCLRPRDLAAAEGAFARAHALATEHGLAVWEVRALHELGTIDLLAGRGTGRLAAAREAAWSSGALATAAVLDVQVAAALSLGDEPGESIVVARRGADLAVRHHLSDTFAAARCFEALAHARLGARVEVDRCERDALSATPGSRNVEMVLGMGRGVLAFIEENRPGAISHLRAAAAIQATSGGDRASGPMTGLWFLVAAVEGANATAPDEPVHYVGRGAFHHAHAVLAGRAGDTDRALALVAEGDEHLRNAPWFRHLGRRLVAEAALADGWSPPPAWLLEALAYFDGRGEERIASACRGLLRRAGVAVPRRRGDQRVPPELRALGITGRELEVLRLLAEGMSNQEIAARLFLSPRTVERHVANMSAKAGAERRAQLVAFAARTVPPLIGG
jgi:DNA-binding CsgD family transcriptional regulator/tetratricopeptide (TPR) repeat protein